MIYIAQPIRDEIVPPLEIKADLPFPRVSGPQHASILHELSARKIFEALNASLPGGTIDALTALLLQAKASRLIVRFPKDAPADA